MTKVTVDLVKQGNAIALGHTPPPVFFQQAKVEYYLFCQICNHPGVSGAHILVVVEDAVDLVFDRLLGFHLRVCSLFCASRNPV